MNKPPGIFSAPFPPLQRAFSLGVGNLETFGTLEDSREKAIHSNTVQIVAVTPYRALQCDSYVENLALDNFSTGPEVLKSKIKYIYASEDYEAQTMDSSANARVCHLSDLTLVPITLLDMHFGKLSNALRNPRRKRKHIS